MSDVKEYQRVCDDLLRRAANTAHLNERSILLSQAVFWHEKALEAECRRTGASNLAVKIAPFRPGPSAPEAP